MMRPQHLPTRGGRRAVPPDHGGVAGLYGGGPWARPDDTADGVGIGAFKPWAAQPQARAAFDDGGSLSDGASAAGDGGGQQGWAPGAGAAAGPAFAPPRRGGGQQAVGRARDQQQPRGGAVATQRRTQAKEVGSLRELLRSACASLGRSAAEADSWASRLEAEWLSGPAQIRALTAEEWSHLGIPMGLARELRRRVGAGGADAELAPAKKVAFAPAQAQAQAAERPARAQSVPARARPEPQAQPQFDEARQLQGQSRAAPGGAPGRPPDAAALRQELRQKFSVDWPSVWLRALRRAVGSDRCADVSALQAACQSLGLHGPAASTAALRSLLRAAAALTCPAGGLPDVEAVLAAVHGPLTGRRAESVRAVFGDLDIDGNGYLVSSMLKKRLNVLEHPGVKAGRHSAEEVHRLLLRPWRSREAVSEADFLACHVAASALWPSDDNGFDRLVREMWCCGRTQRHNWGDGGGDRRAHAPALHGPMGAHGGGGGMALGNGGVAEGHAARREGAARRRAIEDCIKRSSRARELLERLRTVMRRRGNCGDRGGGGVFGEEVLATLERRFFSVTHGRRSLGGRLDAESLREALNEVGIGAAEADVEDLLRAIDIDNSGDVGFEEFLQVVRGPLYSSRARSVLEAFEHLDQDGDGVVHIRDVQERYRPATQPAVEAGRLSADEALRDLLMKLGDRSTTGNLSLADFERYYETMSAGIDNDQYFRHIVRTAWGLDPDENSRGARNKHRSMDGSLQVNNGWIIGRNDSTW